MYTAVFMDYIKEKYNIGKKFGFGVLLFLCF